MDAETLLLRHESRAGRFLRTIASTGPAYETIQDIGEETFIERATELAECHVRDGLPLRGHFQVFGYVGRKQVHG